MDRLREHWDRVAGWALVVIGAVALVLGWFGVSGTVFPAEQLSYIASGGLAGIFCMGLGATLLLSADLRDEWVLLSVLREERQGENPASTHNETAEASPNGHVDEVMSDETRELALTGGE